MEGIMMRNRDKYAVAVRLSDGSVHIKKETIKDAQSIMKIPLVRGVYSFVMSLKMGLGTLMYSASLLEEEEQKESDRGMYVILCAAVVLAVLLFVGVPYGASRLLSGITDSLWVMNAVEGAVKLILFFLYMLMIAKMEDIKRVYMYHGAEHKCINCIESGHALTVENVREASRFHKRCGTSFLFIVVILSVIMHIFIQADNHALQLVIRLLLVPVIAGVAYEFIRLAGRTENPMMGLLSKPGLLMQRITTMEPDVSMIEVGIASVEAVFDWREFIGQTKDDGNFIS